jgi:hypothetical protein
MVRVCKGATWHSVRLLLTHLLAIRRSLDLAIHHRGLASLSMGIPRPHCVDL